MTDAFTVELWYLPDCPLVDRVRTLLADCLDQTGVSATVREIEGPYPSPTLLVNGIVVTGAAPRSATSCRLDLPSRDQIRAALSREVHRIEE